MKLKLNVCQQKERQKTQDLEDLEKTHWEGTEKIHYELIGGQGRKLQEAATTGVTSQHHTEIAVDLP